MAEARLYSTDEAATALKVPSGRIREWRHRGRITPRDTITGRGRGGVVPLYALDDLQPLVDAWRARTAATRPETGA